jgi:DNA-binding NarL/FixJ family response regulator
VDRVAERGGRDSPRRTGPRGAALSFGGSSDRTAVPAPGVSTPPSGCLIAEVRPGDRAVLEQLATGATDQIAAQRLCVSVRTFRRRVAHAMNALGAQSRFQAGVIARAAALV